MIKAIISPDIKYSSVKSILVEQNMESIKIISVIPSRRPLNSVISSLSMFPLSISMPSHIQLEV
jgi:hypothetical protein